MKARIVLGVSAALLAAMPLLAPEYWVTLLSYIGLSSLVVLGVCLLTGVAGQVSFGQAAFVGLGAYATAWLTTAHGLSPWLGLLAGAAVTGTFALVLGLVSTRLSGHYLPLGTIAWGIALYYCFGNLEFLGGFTGLSGIPPLNVFGHELKGTREYCYLIWFCVLLVLSLVRFLLGSRVGRAIRALRTGTTMAPSFGVDTAALKVQVFVFAALTAAVSGWLYAHMQRFVNPTPFGLHVGMEYLFMAVVGGAGYVWGALIGAALIIVLKQVLQNLLPNLTGGSGQFEIILFGALMVIVLQRAREGIWAWVAPRVQRWAPSPTVSPAAPLPTRTPERATGPILEVDRARKAFGGLVAVNDVSFEVAPGEIVGLIGPNGAGKSTTFNLITGLLELSQGAVRFRGQPLSGLPPKRVAQLGVSRTFQHVRLLPGMSVLDNVALGAHLRGKAGFLRCLLRLERREEQELLAEAAKQIERAGLAPEMFLPAGSLPLGKQRIVELARALAADPALLLLDEPAAGLRFQEKRELSALLGRLRAEGITIVLVEHDMDFVMGLVDRLVVLDFGIKLAEGAPSDIQRNPAVLEAYLGAV